MKFGSNVNSGVKGEMTHRKNPTQKPIHIGHWKSSPRLPSFGLIEFRIDPYTRICVSP